MACLNYRTNREGAHQFINEKINERLQSALGADPQLGPREQGASQPAPVAKDPFADQSTVVTTDEERECFYTIKAILHPVIDSKRLALRDVQTYCGVLLDDNNRKPICRLYLNGPRKAIGLFDSDDRKEARVGIKGAEDVHEFTDRLKATLKHYEKVEV